MIFLKVQKLIIIMGLLAIMPLTLFAQVGGQRSFEFQNVPTNTRTTALGGVNVSIADEDINMIFGNPAVNGDTVSGYASFNYVSYFADINAVTFSYQHDLGKYGNWFVGATHFGYGGLIGRDAAGNATEDFDAGETLILIGRNHSVGNFSFGGSLKYVNAVLAEYRASTIAVDLGGVFKHPEKQLNVGLVFKNIGFVISDYTESGDSELPFDVQLGTTFKPEHMPFRFSFTAYNLYKGDIAYYNENNIDPEEEPGTADKIFRHLTVGAELLLSKNVNLRVGYNHLMRQELKLEEASRGAGFSYGLMFRIKAFEFSYSRAGYHAAGALNNFGLTANTNLFFK